MAGDADPAAMREYQDWTDGCIALFNPDIRELYEFVPDGAEVTIVSNAAITPPKKTCSGR
jgi:lipoprotein-anchoring transpeptidase ErfK/SrfK